MMIFDVVRGEDSTGLAMIGANEKTDNFLAKEIGDPYNLFNSFDCFDDKGLVKEAYKFRAFIGHNRWATVGKVNAENAHPFHQGNIIGAHNGTLRNVWRLQDGNKFDVDSEAVFHNLNINTVDETIKNIDGAYALTWWDEREQKMFFIRNKERPLYYARREDKAALFWASEKWMLEIALSKYGVKHGEIKSFDTDTLYSFDLSDYTFNKVKERDLVIERGIEGYKYVGGGANNSSFFPKESSWWDDDKWWNEHYPNKNKNANPNPRPNAGNEKVIGGKLPLAELRKLEGKTITFCIDDECMGMSGLQYLLGMPSSGDDYEIRIFNSGAMYSDLVSLMVIWEAKVKKAVEVKGRNGIIERYLIIDMRTCRELPGTAGRVTEEKIVDIIPFEPRIFPGFDGERLSFLEWEEATKKGCAWCTASATREDKEQIVFITHNEHICHSCQSIDEVKPFLKGLKNANGITLH